MAKKRRPEAKAMRALAPMGKKLTEEMAREAVFISTSSVRYDV